MKKSKEIIGRKSKFTREINRFKGTWSYMRDCTNLKMFLEKESHNPIF